MEMQEKRFVELYRECSGHVRRFVDKRIADRELAEDIVQEVFYVAWKKRKEFTESINPGGWLIKTAKYKMLEQCQYMPDRLPLSLEEWDGQAGMREPGYDMAEWMHLLNDFLDQWEFQLFQEYFLSGLSTREIAMQRGITEGSLRIRLHRMRKRLQAYVTKVENNLIIQHGDDNVVAKNQSYNSTKRRPEGARENFQTKH